MTLKELIRFSGNGIQHNFYGLNGKELLAIKNLLPEFDEFKNKEIEIIEDLGYIGKPVMCFNDDGSISFSQPKTIETWTVFENHAIFQDKIKLYSISYSEKDDMLIFRATPDSFHTGKDSSYKIYNNPPDFFDKN